MKFDHLVKFNGIYYTAGTDVPVVVHAVKVGLTDDVPEGALDSNADGSVNTYDEDGNVVGTLSSEEVEELQKEAGAAFEAQEKPKRGRKSKEAQVIKDGCVAGGNLERFNK